jgi:hypothetical protein
MLKCRLQVGLDLVPVAVARGANADADRCEEGPHHDRAKLPLFLLWICVQCERFVFRFPLSICEF